MMKKQGQMVEGFQHKAKEESPNSVTEAFKEQLI